MEWLTKILELINKIWNYLNKRKKRRSLDYIESWYKRYSDRYNRSKNN